MWLTPRVGVAEMLEYEVLKYFRMESWAMLKKKKIPQIRGKSEIKNAKKKKKNKTQQTQFWEPCKRFQNKKTLKYMSHIISENIRRSQVIWSQRGETLSVDKYTNSGTIV